MEAKNKKMIITILITILIITAIIILIFNGYIIPTKLEAEKYEIRGVDASEYQGEINWDKIKEQGINFAFIKATEGSKTKDNYFDKNYQQLKNIDILLGCYHFFSFETKGEEQVQNYINTVGNIENNDSLILPIIDIEYYSSYKKAKPSKQWVTEELQVMLDKLENSYRIKPIIYTTIEFYNYYINDNFYDYDIWIRNIITKPKLENREWKFWQYTGRGRLEGYSGEEKFIDLNVFNGSKEEFDKYIQSKKQEKKNNFKKEEQEKIEIKENTITSIYGAIVTNIEENKYIIKTYDEEKLEVTITDDMELINRRTEEITNINKIKIGEKLDFHDIYIRQGKIVFTEKTKIYITRKIQGEELKKEMLKGEINFTLKNITKNRKQLYIKRRNDRLVLHY